MIQSLQQVEQHQHPNGGGWVANTAEVHDTAFIGPDAQIFGNAQISGNARISGYARVFGNARISGNAQIFGNPQIFGNAQISGNALVLGTPQIFGNAQISGNARIYGDEWSASPLYIQGSRHALTNSRHGHIAIGCYEHPFAYWEKHAAAIGRANNYNKAQIKEYQAHIAYLIKRGQ